MRVYNCSYVDTTDVKAELYWTNEWKDESELTEADKVGTSGLYAIKGWQSTGDSNIKEIAVEWSASKKLSDNDWGYVRMALLAPDVYEGTDASSVSSAKLAASKSSSASAQPPVTAEFVKKSAEIITENGQKYIQAKVHLTSSVALPDVKLLVISHQKNGENIIVAGRALGGIHTGESNVVTVKAPLVEEIAKNSTGVSVKVLSPWLKPDRPKNGGDSGGSSGGCSAGIAGFAALFALALLPLAGGRRKK